MKKVLTILSLIISNLCTSFTFAQLKIISFDFYGIKVELPVDTGMIIPFNDPLSENSVASFVEQITDSEKELLTKALLNYKSEYKLDDWLLYQLIRSTAQQISPKAENYNMYTLYKWFLLTSLGYDARLKLANDQLLFYVQCEENIYDIPSYIKDGKQFVCLNYHDFESVDFERNGFKEIVQPRSGHSFSYRVSSLPEFSEVDYEEKTIHFNYYQQNQQLRFKFNRNIRNIFRNYPTVDYSFFFNIPLSSETYNSLIPVLKENVKPYGIKEGVDYLMRFTRYAFFYQTDTHVFGSEKRLTPEQTLFSEYSDCEDRAGLLFYLVKEIYDLPMIVLSYPNHVTIAVKFDKPLGKPIIYNGESYSICEATPQKKDLKIGELPKEIRGMKYEIVYAYSPAK